jgi:glutamate 5-kinase
MPCETQKESMLLPDFPRWQRAVLKIGSNLIAPGGHALSVRHVLGVAQFVQQARLQGREVIVVSSGAVAAGRACLRAQQQVNDARIAAKQALAAIGQTQLMTFWQQFFDLPVAQLLLTHDDLVNRRRFVNAKNTLRELMALDVLPVINENDSVAVDELRVGDNDNLAAHVAVLCEADLLIIASDIDGLFDADPRSKPDAQLIPYVEQVTDAIMVLAGGAGSKVGTGGMRTKLQAARAAAERGIATVIINAQKPQALMSLLQQHVSGTWFASGQAPKAAKKHWMLHALPIAGQLHIDAGAAAALCEKGASLLPSGVVRVSGDFNEGDAVEIFHHDKRLAKGIVQYDSVALARIAGCRSQEIETRLGFSNGETVIHRDDLALLDNQG